MSAPAPTPPVPPADPTPPAPTDPPAPSDPPLGENGEKALKAEREARTAAEKVAAALQKQLDDIAAAYHSDLEKAQKAAQDAQEKAAKANSEALRYRIAAETGITENADLILTGSDEETMRKQAALWAGRTPEGSPAPRPDLSQGGSGSPAGTTPAQEFASLIQQMPG